MVFEALEQNLHNFIKQRQFKPLPMSGIRRVLKQLLTTLSKLKERKLIHSDVKPENIMFVNTEKDPYGIKVIDFGCAIHVSQASFPTYIQSRFYRAPEIILGLPFSEAIDMWSVGCIAVEIFLGRPLYPGRSEYDQLRCIMKTQGDPPDDMLYSGAKTVKFFCRETQKCRRRWRFKTPQEYTTENVRRPDMTTQHIFGSLDEIAQIKMPQDMKDEDLNREISERKVFVNFVKRMLTLDPKHRISPEEALNHEFLTLKNNLDSTERKEGRRTSRQIPVYVLSTCYRVQPDPRSVANRTCVENDRTTHSDTAATTSDNLCPAAPSRRCMVVCASGVHQISLQLSPAEGGCLHC